MSIVNTRNITRGTERQARIPSMVHTRNIFLQNSETHGKESIGFSGKSYPTLEILIGIMKEWTGNGNGIMSLQSTDQNL